MLPKKRPLTPITSPSPKQILLHPGWGGGTGNGSTKPLKTLRKKGNGRLLRLNISRPGILDVGLACRNVRTFQISGVFWTYIKENLERKLDVCTL